MATNPEKSAPAPGQKPRTQPKQPRFFYPGAALLLLVLMFWGFQQFYFHGRAYPNRELTPPIRTLIILHGIAMLAWTILFVVQPFLIATGKRPIHMTLGKVGVGLAGIIVVLGYALGIGAARVNPPDLLLWNLNPRQFLAIPIISISIFGIFVAVGVWNRKNPGIHRPMMLLSMLTVMPAALDRIDPIQVYIRGTVMGTIFGPACAALVIGLGLFLLKWVLTRSFDRWFAIGFLGLVVADAAIMRVATTGVWASITGFLVG